VAAINRAGVEISREAAGGQARVFASMGPTGKMLMSGEVLADEILGAFTEQADALARAGADALVVETMCDIEEAKLAIQAARHTRLPVVACMVFDSGKDKDRTMMGSTPEQVAKALEQAGADVIGANCGQGIETAIGVCRRLKAASSLPVWIKPNAGLPQMKEGKVRYATGAEDFASYVPKLLEAGASFVGGCCGTSPDFIRAVRAAVNRG
jgi:methionine synthase I (cobalamin-dependent)